MNDEAKLAYLAQLAQSSEFKRYVLEPLVVARRGFETNLKSAEASVEEMRWAQGAIHVVDLFYELFGDGALKRLEVARERKKRDYERKSNITANQPRFQSSYDRHQRLNR